MEPDRLVGRCSFEARYLVRVFRPASQVIHYARSASVEGQEAVGDK